MFFSRAIEIASIFLRGGGYAAALLDPFYYFRKVIIRRNVIRQLAPLTSTTYAAITIMKAENLVVEDNVIDLESAQPIKFQNCGNVKILNNRTPAGTLIRGKDNDTSRLTDEISTIIEDAMVIML